MRQAFYKARESQGCVIPVDHAAHYRLSNLIQICIQRVRESFRQRHMEKIDGQSHAANLRNQEQPFGMILAILIGQIFIELVEIVQNICLVTAVYHIKNILCSEGVYIVVLCIVADAGRSHLVVLFQGQLYTSVPLLQQMREWYGHQSG